MSYKRRVWLRVNGEAEKACTGAISALAENGLEVSAVVSADVPVPSFEVPGPNGPRVVCGLDDIREWANKNSGE